MKFRQDIGALRAIAVILVVLYHTLPSAVPGGFIGVDVFFVISGFLMTSIITTQYDKGTFSLLSFYGSRTRRILPALVVCILISFVLAFYFGGYYETLSVLRKTARNALLGLSNFYFYKNTGYFDVAANVQVFLHTWSLGVELQFYLIYPILLLGLRKIFGVPFIKSIIGLLILSFITSCVLVYTDQTAAFYLLPSRFWGFLVGGCLALYHRKYEIPLL